MITRERFVITGLCLQGTLEGSCLQKKVRDYKGKVWDYMCKVRVCRGELCVYSGKVRENKGEVCEYKRRLVITTQGW